MLRSIMRAIAWFDIVHLRVRTPLPRSTHGLLAFRPLLVAFAAVARRGVDVVSLALAIMDSPMRSVAVRPGGMVAHPAGPLFCPGALSAFTGQLLRVHILSRSCQP